MRPDNPSRKYPQLLHRELGDRCIGVLLTKSQEQCLAALSMNSLQCQKNLLPDRFRTAALSLSSVTQTSPGDGLAPGPWCA